MAEFQRKWSSYYYLDILYVGWAKLTRMGKSTEVLVRAAFVQTLVQVENVNFVKLSHYSDKLFKRQLLLFYLFY